MPGIDGIELCSKIRKSDFPSYIYLIMITGKDESEGIIEALNAGADDYMTKPVNSEVLKGRLKVAIRMLDYELELSIKNEQLTNNYELLKKYASEMQQLAEKRAEQLVHAKQLSTLGELSAGIAHEVNNYLAPVMGYTELLKMTSDSFTKENFDESKTMWLECIDSVHTSAKRIQVLMERLRVNSRKRTLEMVDAQINDIILYAMELCINKLKFFKVEKNLTENLPDVRMELQGMEQVLVNLLKNAADAMDGQKDGEIIVSTSRIKKGVRITIEDSGEGIAEDKLEDIWQSFFTTKDADKGTGLGLSICKGIVQDHNGLIKAENRKCGGAKFIIELPETLT